MKLKRFVAKDMRQALAKIKEELGAEAVIMSNKRIEGGVEIIAGVEETITPHSTPIEPSTTNTITSKAAKDNGPLSRMLKEDEVTLGQANAKLKASQTSVGGQKAQGFAKSLLEILERQQQVQSKQASTNTTPKSAPNK